MIIILQIIAVIILLSLGAFFSGSETGVYRLSRFKLRVGVEQKRPFYSLLGKLVSDSQALVFSILLGNNLANCIVTSLITVILLNALDNPETAQLYTTLIMTPLLFTFSEVIPKNVYYYRADKLMPRLAPLLFAFHWLFKLSGATLLLGILSRTLSSRIGPGNEAAETIRAARQGRIRGLIHETHEEGILSSVQNEMMKRLVNVPAIRVGAVMTGRSRMLMLNVNSDRQILMDTLKEHSYTNYPVYDGSRNNIVGIVNIYNALASGETFNDLRKYLKPINTFSPSMPLIEAIVNMQKNSHKMVIVTAETRSKQKSIGLITMKDLVEELTGELVQW